MLLDQSTSEPDPVTGAMPLAPLSAKALLLDIIEQSAQRLVVFDLDSTLLDNRPRSAVIMRKYADQFDQPMLLNASREHFPTWSARDSMALLGMAETAIDQVLDDYLDFWTPRFFNSSYCQYDVTIAGAAKFVNAIQSAGGIVHYLTGRDESMREGTHLSLESLGFPSPEQGDVKLIMKPVAAESDDAYKHNELQKISTAGNLLAAFDNEPTHINNYRSVFPDSVSVHLDTDHSMREVRLLDGIISIKDFDH